MPPIVVKKRSACAPFANLATVWYQCRWPTSWPLRNKAMPKRNLPVDCTGIQARNVRALSSRVGEIILFLSLPSDAKSSASVEVFAHLHQAMIRKGMVAMGELLTRVTATSRFVVVRALPEEWDLLTSLPELDEKPPPPLVTRELVQVAIDLVQRQTLVGVGIGSVFSNAAMENFGITLSTRRSARRVEWMNRTIRKLTRPTCVSRRERNLMPLAKSCPRTMLPRPREDEAKRESARRSSLTTGIDREQLYNNGTVSKCNVGNVRCQTRRLRVRCTTHIYKLQSSAWTSHAGAPKYRSRVTQIIIALSLGDRLNRRTFRSIRI
jgi:hypothetical protein